MFNFYPDGITNIQHGLLEVVDNENRPVCLLQEEHIMAQRLLHRRAAIHVHSRDNQIMLRQNPAGQLDFAGEGPVPAGLSSQEQARELLIKLAYATESDLPGINFLGGPHVSAGAFVYLYSISFSLPWLRQLASSHDNLIVMEYMELRELINHADLVAPALAGIYSAGFLK